MLVLFLCFWSQGKVFAKQGLTKQLICATMRRTVGRGLTEVAVEHSNQIKNHLVVTDDPDCEFVYEHFITPPFCGLTKRSTKQTVCQTPWGRKKEKSRSGLLFFAEKRSRPRDAVGRRLLFPFRHIRIFFDCQLFYFLDQPRRKRLGISFRIIFLY